MHNDRLCIALHGCTCGFYGDRHKPAPDHPEVRQHCELIETNRTLLHSAMNQLQPDAEKRR